MSLLLCRLLQAYMIVLFARIIMSWFPIQPNSGLSSVYGFLYAVTEPILGPLRRIIPPLGMGGMGLDLSPLIVFFAIRILLGVVC
ncbi:MAG: YggT family protein [Acidimicrobiales bacterium]|nr:YggT family protein [Actinomycetota bacterium]